MSKTKNTKKTKSSNANQTTKISHILLIMIAVTAVLIVATVYGLRRYENGILDVCATQQDSYVQLVIDQINLKENRTDQEIIENILSTLDSSSNRYWTFSKSQTMLYVKDALETNKYQSLTANSYYQSDTAKAFVDHLLQNKVTHSEIEIDGKKYIASGVLFEYGGENYRICLLTNRTVLLDNNAFLGAKMELILLFVLSYAAIFILPIVLVMLRNYLILKEQATRADLDDMSQKVMALNERLTTTELYDNRKNLFQLATVERFVEELKGEKKAYPISFLAFRYPQDSTVANFFGGNCLALGQRDIKFYDGRLHLALILCVGCDASQAKNLSAKIRPKNTLLGSHTAMDGSHLSMAYEAIFRDMGDPDIHAQPAARVERPDSRTESRYRSKENGSQNVQQTPPVRETKPEEKKTGASVQEIKPATQEMKPAVKPVVPEAKTAVQENPPAVKEAPVQRAETRAAEPPQPVQKPVEPVPSTQPAPSVQPAQPESKTQLLETADPYRPKRPTVTAKDTMVKQSKIRPYLETLSWDTSSYPVAIALYHPVSTEGLDNFLAVISHRTWDAAFFSEKGDDVLIVITECNRSRFDYLTSEIRSDVQCRWVEVVTNKVDSMAATYESFRAKHKGLSGKIRQKTEEA